MTGQQQDARSYYQRFSLQVGARDWRLPNARHEVLKQLVDQELEQLRLREGKLKIYDVGCGAGVLSAFLTRFGKVDASDFSEPAIAYGRQMAPQVDFFVGDATSLPTGKTYDLITLFDVAEHIPADQLPAVVRQLSELLEPGGVLLLSTPHPQLSIWMQQHAKQLRQAVDEVVDPLALVQLAVANGLQLRSYRSYEIDFYGPQYQLLVFAKPFSGQEVGARVARPLGAGTSRLSRATNPVTASFRLACLSLQQVRRGRLRLAWALIKGDR